MTHVNGFAELAELSHCYIRPNVIAVAYIVRSTVTKHLHYLQV